MNGERFERLVKLFKEKKYFVVLRDLSIWTNVDVKKPNKRKMKPVIKINRAYVRLTDGLKRYEYEMHEIISVWIGAFVLDRKCYFIDGNRLNYHPSNLHWHAKDKNPGRKTRFTKEEILKIQNFKCVQGDKSKPVEKFIKEMNISKDYFYKIRYGKVNLFRNEKTSNV